MREVSNHKAYELLKNQYEDVCLDYVILQSEEEYDGEQSHKKAVCEAFHILNKRFEEYEFHIDMDPDKMTAVSSTIEELLLPPADAYYEDRPKGNRCYSIPSPLPYWYAFLEPPYGTHYLKSDFIAFHESLFPDQEGIEVYRWNDDFSNYFDAGKEWWGTGLWTVYDAKNKLFVVIGASLTD